MATFSDDFERPDGPLGANWYVITGVPSIGGGIVGGHPGWAARPATFTASGYVSASTVMKIYGMGGPMGQINIKANTTGGNGYCAQRIWDGVHVTCQIYKQVGAFGNILASAYATPASGADCPVSISYRDGVITAVFYGTITLTAEDDDYAVQAYGAMASSDWQVGFHSYSVTSDPPASLEVTPNPLWVGGGQTQMTAILSDATWTPGTPGSTIFAADHGIVNSQWVEDAHTARIIYTPAEYIGPIVFSESEHNTSDTVNAVAVRPDEYPVAGGQLTQNAVDYIEYSATHGGWGILNEGQTVTQSSGVTTVGDALGWFWRTLAKLVDPDGETPSGNTYIDVLWYILNGRNAPVVNESIYDELLTTRNTTNHIEELFAGVEPDTWVSILQLMSYLKGVDDKDLSQVFDQIGASDTAMSASLMNAIEAVRGTDLPSIRTVVDLIGELSTIAGYDLSSIKGWVEAARGTDLPTIRAVLDFLQTIRGNNVVTLDGLALQLGGLSDASETIYLMLHTLTNAETLTLQSVLDAIAAIPASDLSAVLTAISDLRGDSTSTVKAILDSLTAYRNPQGYTVQSILDKIGSPPDGNEWNPLLLGLLLLLVAAGDGIAVASFISKVKDGTLDTILDIIDIAVDVANLFHNLWDHFNPASPTYRPTSAPVYPGPDKVYWDTAIPFDGQITIEQQMDGARIDIETPGEHPFAIKLSTPTRYGRLGVFSFMADDGLLEPIQPVQWAKQIITAKGIAIPMGLVVQCKAGTIGTITPWRLK